MLKKIVYLVIFYVSLSILNSFYADYSEAYVNEKSFPLTEKISANFEPKLTAQYKIVIRFKQSKELAEASSKAGGGDAAQRSENLGHYLLEGVKLKVDNLTSPNTSFHELFSIMGGAPLGEITDYEWDPFASFLVATFKANRGDLYRLTITQPLSDSDSKKIKAPAYVMITSYQHWKQYLIYITLSMTFVFIVLSALFDASSFPRKAIRHWYFQLKKS